MKRQLILKSLFLILAIGVSFFSVKAQVPDWTDTTCNGDIYHLYDELSAGHPVVIDFAAMWCVPSNVMAPTLDSLYRNYGSGTGNLRVFGFVVENMALNATTCSNVSLFQSQRHVTFPCFANCRDVYNTYLAAYHDTAFPTILLIIPDQATPSASTIAFNSVHDLTTTDSLYFQLDSILKNKGYFPTGIDETDKVQGINRVTVYPNPAHGRFTVSTGLQLRAASIKMINTLGQVVYHEELPDGPLTAKEISADVHPGIYFVHLTSGNRHYINKVLIE
jgi:thiol-disulfide isomerase/thioredoxin